MSGTPKNRPTGGVSAPPAPPDSSNFHKHPHTDNEPPTTGQPRKANHMARPVMRDLTGRWSLVQLAHEAGVTHRTARTIVASGYLDPNNLTLHDIVTLRVAAALLDSPRPTGEPRNTASPATTRRNNEALRLARQVARHTTPSKDARLVITPTTATLVDDPFDLVTILRRETDPALLLPLGEWAQELQTITNTGRAAAS